MTKYSLAELAFPRLSIVHHHFESLITSPLISLLLLSSPSHTQAQGLSDLTFGPRSEPPQHIVPVDVTILLFPEHPCFMQKAAPESGLMLSPFPLPSGSACVKAPSCAPRACCVLGGIPPGPQSIPGMALSRQDEHHGLCEGTAAASLRDHLSVHPLLTPVPLLHRHTEASASLDSSRSFLSSPCCVALELLLSEHSCAHHPRLLIPVAPLHQ